MEAELKPGMCFTIEPGLYFREDDLLVPAEMRGTGVRIEDDAWCARTAAWSASLRTCPAPWRRSRPG